MATPTPATEPVAASGWQSFVAYFASPDVTGLLTLAGTIASVLGLGFTIWVLFSVRTIRAHFLFAARIPQILEALQANASTISKGLTDYDANAHLIEVELAKCSANLGNLSMKVKKRSRKNVLVVMNRINGPRAQNDKEEVRTIYTALNGIIQELQNLQEDMKWSDTNG